MSDRGPEGGDTRQDEHFEAEVERELERRERERREGRRAEGNGEGREEFRAAAGSRARPETEEEELAARPAPSEDGQRSSTEEGSSLRVVVRGVIANGPWRMFLSFKAVIAAALATGAYALIFPTLWILADSFSWPRLVGLAVSSIVIMVGWMILAHSLWEKPSDEAEKNPAISATTQNVVTLITLITGVLFSYAVLFGLIFLAAIVFVDGAIFESNVGHPVGPADYAYLAWVATSISTITGSLGGGLEDENDVREAVNVR